ncbi:hypothetical protein GCK32_022505 [Trichostrongylus colubriformis]|uniref:Uncharacterized protein n=1 Tax=Trichostrongylus colubriformis TaxID=6319 RepID=A0AAN8J041_TRICO
MNDCRNIEQAVQGTTECGNMVQNFEDESTEVRTRTSEELLASGLSGQIEEAIVAIRDIGPKIRADLEGARIAAKYRAIIEQAVTDRISRACGSLETLREGAEKYRTFGKAVTEALRERGITTVDDWNDFLKVVERDGELVTEICSMLNTDVSQVRDIVAEIQELQDKQARNRRNSCDELSDEPMEGVKMNSEGIKSSVLFHGDNDRHLQTTARVAEPSRAATQTGAPCVQHSRQRSDRWDTAAERGEAEELSLSRVRVKDIYYIAAKTDVWTKLASGS